MQRKGKANGSVKTLTGRNGGKSVGLLEGTGHEVKENMGVGQYWLTRIVFLRYICFIYLIAFLVSLEQNEALIGEHGLTPAVDFLTRYSEYVGGESATLFQRFSALPTLFWLFEPSNYYISAMSMFGAGLALLVLISGSANVPIMLALWVTYMSIVNVGQTWYSFGWESQLLETGFLSIFMVPVWSLSQLPSLTPTPLVVVWGYRWLLFRIMLGAGLIKIRGDSCWRDLTCMEYHYQVSLITRHLRLH